MRVALIRSQNYVDRRRLESLGGLARTLRSASGGQAALFTRGMPFARRTRPPSARRPDMKKEPKAQRATILVVDDNEANRLLAQNTLEDDGYRVTSRTLGRERWARA